MKAQLLFRYKAHQGKLILEMVVWRLPTPSPDRPHGLKYRLYCGDGKDNVLRYDNESGKGCHRHVEEREHPYRFVSLDQLIDDFKSDCARLIGWRW